MIVAKSKERESGGSPPLSQWYIKGRDILELINLHQLAIPCALLLLLIFFFLLSSPSFFIEGKTDGKKNQEGRKDILLSHYSRDSKRPSRLIIKDRESD